MSEKTFKVLAINPGSTSTKIAVYQNEELCFKNSIEHDAHQLSQFKLVNDQFAMRRDAVFACLKEVGFPLNELSAVAGRGGTLPPVKQGAYRVNQAMIDHLNRRRSTHAATLGAMIAYEIAEPLKIPAYIYDATNVDEFDEVARISGLPEINRRSQAHVLNMRATALKVANAKGKALKDLNLIVTHIGGGITSTIISKGKMIDVVADDEGTFSPERAGNLPIREFADFCFSGKHDYATVTKKVRGKGGLVAYLGTNKALEVEERIRNGDKYAELVYCAMAYQIAKDIGQLATVVSGKVDAIVLTGGIAHSRMLTDWIVEKVQFIAPVEIMPGENELEALALGVLRVLREQETCHEFVV